jgi:hypothetical protein
MGSGVSVIQGKTSSLSLGGIKGIRSYYRVHVAIWPKSHCPVIDANTDNQVGISPEWPPCLDPKELTGYCVNCWNTNHRAIS